MTNNKSNDYDVVVIGAGLGGLFAGAKLAKEGKRVLVVEQHSIPGGYATQFKRKGFVFEAGLHAWDGLFSDTNPNLAILDDLNIRDNLSFVRLPEFYHVQRGDLGFTLADDIALAEKELCQRFPREPKAIKRYMELLVRLRKEILNFPITPGKTLAMLPLAPILYPTILKNIFSTLHNFLDRLTNNEDLKLILSANTAYYHTDPKKYALLHYGGAQSIYLSGGCAYIKGGSYKLAQYVSSFIESHGGTVLFNTSATKIPFRNSAISGVTMQSTRDSSQINEVSCEVVVANANMPTVINSLLPKEKSAKLQKRFGTYQLSHSAFCIYLGLKKPLHTIGNNRYCAFILPKELTRFSDLGHHNTTKDYTKKIISLVDYSLIEANLNEDNAPTASVMVVDEIDQWEGLSPSEYKEKKERVADSLMKEMENYLPGISQLVAHREIATPKTFERYTLNPGGCIYGYAQSVNQIGPKRPNIYSSIPGLYFASAWTKPGGGLSPVSKSGYTAACQILKKYS